MKLTELFDNYYDKLTGGKGDHLKPQDVDKSELIVGIYVEMEHTNDPMIACSIALDHLAEVEDYYARLVKCGLVDEPKALKYAHKLLNIK